MCRDYYDIDDSSSYEDAGYRQSDLSKVRISCWSGIQDDEKCILRWFSYWIQNPSTRLHWSCTDQPNKTWEGHGSRSSVSSSFRAFSSTINSYHFLTDKVIPRQLFEVPIQAAVGKRIIARETLSALRADVTAGLYGGMSKVSFFALRSHNLIILPRSLRTQVKTSRKSKGEQASDEENRDDRASSGSVLRYTEHETRQIDFRLSIRTSLPRGNP